MEYAGARSPPGAQGRQVAHPRQAGGRPPDLAARPFALCRPPDPCTDSGGWPLGVERPQADRTAHSLARQELRRVDPEPVLIHAGADALVVTRARRALESRARRRRQAGDGAATAAHSGAAGASGPGPCARLGSLVARPDPNGRPGAGPANPDSAPHRGIAADSAPALGSAGDRADKHITARCVGSCRNRAGAREHNREVDQ